MALARLIAPFRNATVGSALVFAASGAAFAVANILLARGLPIETYAQFALAMAVYNVAALVAPLGTDQLSIRRSLTFTSRIVLAQLATASFVGLFSALAARAYVGLELSATLALAAAIAAGGVMVGTTAEMRRGGSTFAALAIYISPNLGLVAIGAVTLAFGITSLSLVLWSYVLVTLVATVLALLRASAGQRLASGPSGYRFAEALPLVGMVAVSSLALQMERLVLPAVMDLKGLATFSLLATLAIFPFRLISAGMGFALTPQLSDRDKLPANFARVRTEMLALAGLLLLGAAILVVLVPLLMPWLTNGRYQAGHWLVLAACCSGAVTVGQALARSIITALGSVGMLHGLNLASSAGLVLMVIGAWLGSPYGLMGVILAVAGAQALVTLPLLVVAWRGFAKEAQAA